jgi:hypothetical protein
VRTGVGVVRSNGHVVGHALIEPSPDHDSDFVAHIVWSNSPEATSPASDEKG